jgi:hypothetical protein
MRLTGEAGEALEIVPCARELVGAHLAARPELWRELLEGTLRPN